MKSCYVVMRNVPDVNDENNVYRRVEALTENLYLAEKVIANYFACSFGEDGRDLVCTISPRCEGLRTYRMESHYKTKAKGATYFEVYEEEIKDDAALL